MSARKLLLTIFGAVLALLGLGLLAGGGVLLIGYGTQRDADGFITSPDYELTSGGYAITSERLSFGAEVADWIPGAGDFQFRITATPADADQPIFLGVATQDELANYLEGSSYSQITRFGIGDRVTYRTETGGPLPQPPSAVDLWDASVEGTGTQTLTWDAQEGDWEFALLNADGSAGITVIAEGGAKLDLLIPIGFGLLFGGLVLGAIGVVLLILGAAVSDPREPSAGSQGPAPDTRDQRASADL